MSHLIKLIDTQETADYFYYLWEMRLVDPFDKSAKTTQISQAVDKQQEMDWGSHAKGLGIAADSDKTTVWLAIVEDIFRMNNPDLDFTKVENKLGFDFGELEATLPDSKKEKIIDSTNEKKIKLR